LTNSNPRTPTHLGFDKASSALHSGTSASDSANRGSRHGILGKLCEPSTTLWRQNSTAQIHLLDTLDLGNKNKNKQEKRGDTYEYQRVFEINKI
jgi:hypothetical protein